MTTRHVEAMRLTETPLEVRQGDLVPVSHPDTEDTVSALVVGAFGPTPIVRCTEEHLEAGRIVETHPPELYWLDGAKYVRRAR